MSLEQWELHSERLSTTDESGGRVFLYPSEVRGKYRNRRTIIHSILIAFFLGLPWLHWNGRQAVLFDLPNRRFSFFSLTFWAHEAPMLFFVLAIAGFSLFFATALWGRVWCGWACPQTVFIDGVFRRIEKWTEGSALERRKMDAGPLSFKKFFKKSMKWLGFLGASLVITNSFLAYFVGSERLITMVQHSPSENWIDFLLVAIFTGVLLFDFGWFREQFCTIICPYGRFQSVLMDRNSQIVAYDKTRGEPRRGHVKENEKQGDCVNCYRCVQVCPTGVDIRRGTQMECIACTACIDACDEVMTKIKKPVGLIRYDSERGLSGLQKKHVTPRTTLYLGAILIATAFLTYKVGSRDLVRGVFIRAKDSPYQVVTLENQNKIVVNHFKVDLSNHRQNIATARLELTDELHKLGAELVMAQPNITLQAGQPFKSDLFIRFPITILKRGSASIKIRIISKDLVDQSEAESQEEVTLVGPFT